jgi:hypothetical protein
MWPWWMDKFDRRVTIGVAVFVVLYIAAMVAIGMGALGG